MSRFAGRENKKSERGMAREAELRTAMFSVGANGTTSYAQSSSETDRLPTDTNHRRLKQIFCRDLPPFRRAWRMPE